MGVRVGHEPRQNHLELKIPGAGSPESGPGRAVASVVSGLSVLARAFEPGPSPMLRLRALMGSESVLSKRQQVSEFILRHLNKGSFSVKVMQRAVARDFHRERGTLRVKPNGMEVRSMYDPRMFGSGSTAVPSNLKPERMMELHCGSCDLCREHYKTHGRCKLECYYTDLDQCITKGWMPEIRAQEVKALRKIRNSQNCKLYPEKVAEEFGKMEADEYLVRLDTFIPGVHTLNALGAVVKKGDILRARALTGIEVVDEDSLRAASRQLQDMGFLKIKVRITIDCTGSGVNGATYSPSFTMPGFEEALRRVYRDCWMSKGDVSHYFHSFPIARAFRDFLVVELEEGVFLQYMVVPMGFTACPYYASTWSAEMRQWMLTAGLDPAFLMDDWFEVGDKEEVARSRMRTLYDLIESTGHGMAEEKFEVAQMMVFLGILIDSTTMTCRIDKVQAAGFKQQLLLYLERLRVKGGDLDLQTVRHVAGKLSWYCEVIQSGRMHINAWWLYAGTLEEWHNNRDIPPVIAELEWWVGILGQWEHDDDCTHACRIYNCDELLAHPESFQLVQSDASGTDGFGYVCSQVGSEGYRYYSKTWVTLPVHSHQAELLALLEYFRKDLVRDTLIMWITDCQSAAWTVNKGNCDDPLGRVVLAEILGLCDLFQCQLFAVWIPRENNVLPDHLSHLSFLMHREEVSGHGRGAAL